MARKKKEIEPETYKAKLEERAEAVYVYHNTDDISKIAKLLTGKEFMEYKLLAYNNKTMNTLADGDVLKWGI